MILPSNLDRERCNREPPRKCHWFMWLMFVVAFGALTYYLLITAKIDLELGFGSDETNEPMNYDTSTTEATTTRPETTTSPEVSTMTTTHEDTTKRTTQKPLIPSTTQNTTKSTTTSSTTTTTPKPTETTSTTMSTTTTSKTTTTQSTTTTMEPTTMTTTTEPTTTTTQTTRSTRSSKATTEHTTPPSTVDTTIYNFTVETTRSLDEMISAVNRNVNACDDFYKFACGKLKKDYKKSIKEQIANDVYMAFRSQKSKRKTLPKQVDEMYDFFMQCEAEKPGGRIPKLQQIAREFIEKLGGLPIAMGQSWKPVALDTILKELVLFNFYPFFEFKLMPNHQLKLTTKVPMAGSEEENQNRSSLFSEIIQNDFAHGSKANNDWVSQMIELDEFINELAEIVNEKTNESYSLFKASSLQRQIQKMNLSEIVYWNNPSAEHRKLTKNDVISVDLDEDSFKSYAALISNASERVLINYALLTFYVKMREMSNVHDKVDCYEWTKSIHILPIQYIYKVQHSERFAVIYQNSREEVLVPIVAQLRNRIDSNDLMDKETTQAAHDKVDYLSIKQLDELDELKHEIEVVYDMLPDMSKMGLYQRALHLNHLNEMLKTFEFSEADKKSAFLSVSQNLGVDVKNWPEASAMIVQDGAVYPPLYDTEYLDLLNYARLGSFYGKELTFLFDDEGMKYDKEGKKSETSQWTDATRMAFNKKRDCLSNYSKYDFVKPMEASIDELIPEIGGFTVAFEAYKQRNKNEEFPTGYHGYNTDQLFFIANAQAVCSASIMNKKATKTRVNFNALAQPSFASAFNCDIESKTHPEIKNKEKCLVW